MSLIHRTGVFAFENKAKTNFVDGESSYLAGYNGIIVSELWTSRCIRAVDIFARSWDNFGALSSQRLFDEADLPRSMPSS